MSQDVAYGAITAGRYQTECMTAKPPALRWPADCYAVENLQMRWIVALPQMLLQQVAHMHVAGSTD